MFRDEDLDNAAVRSEDLTTTFALTDSDSDVDEDEVGSNNSRDNLLNDDSRDRDHETTTDAMREWIKMDSPAQDKIAARVRGEEVAGERAKHSTQHEATIGGHHTEEARLATNLPAQYRVYKRRWFGLFQLVLLNIIVSWDVRILTHPPQAHTKQDATN